MTATRLNFACGSTRWPGFENSDINGEPGVVHVDLEDRPYPYPDGSAALVMISHGLQMTHDGHRPVHPNLQAIFREFHRILEPGGWLRVDDNPMRIFRHDDDVPMSERAAEMSRGFPEELCLERDVFIEMLSNIGFDPIIECSPDRTQIPCDDETRAAIVGNHLHHCSFAIEAQKC